jgi:plastocyanin
VAGTSSGSRDIVDLTPTGERRRESMRSVRYLALLVGTALLVAGCGGGGGGGGGGAPSSSGPYAPPFQEPCQVKEGRVVVDIRETEFVCDELTIPAETQVIWTNSDEVEHTVTKTSGPGSDFNSGPLQPGSTFSQVLKETGNYKIVDEETRGDQRPEMTIVVEEKEETEPAPGGQPGGQP